jgi:ABC-type Na+ efflux pump permease subunit
MNAFVRKEVRLLLPSFVLGLLLACSVWLWPERSDAPTGIRAVLVVLPFLVWPVVLILMTLSSFGRELSAGTFSQLLVQPVPRARVWWTKTLLLAAAVVLIWAVWWISLSHHSEFLALPREEQRDTFLTTVLFVVAAYSGGLWTALLVRQFAAAFWLTLLAPAALATAIAGLFSRESDTVHPALRAALIIGLSLYGVGGFLFARWLFLRAQDTQWTGGTIALPSVRGLAGLFRRRGDRRQWRPRAALWMKELQLHQSQFVLAAALALLHVAVIATRKFGGGFKNTPALAFLLEQFWVLWLAMPLLVGCTAVAEERKLGTLEAQLCMPLRRRMQFFVKFVSALLLSVLLGAAMPVLFEGNNILTGFQPESNTSVANYAVRRLRELSSRLAAF